ncbi:hypothetical protein WJX74_006432 [Apatococcus lobatus]|uniref:rRNA methyltransferase 1, mitochondrial n=1 Tax=Apatococcus lobatus TaxID=904363 RepID=A0AAW1Q6S4_9CHLO
MLRLAVGFLAGPYLLRCSSTTFRQPPVLSRQARAGFAAWTRGSSRGRGRSAAAAASRGGGRQQSSSRGSGRFGSSQGRGGGSRSPRPFQDELQSSDESSPDGRQPRGSGYPSRGGGHPFRDGRTGGRGSISRTSTDSARYNEPTSSGYPFMDNRTGGRGSISGTSTDFARYPNSAQDSRRTSSEYPFRGGGNPSRGGGYPSRGSGNSSRARGQDPSGRGKVGRSPPYSDNDRIPTDVYPARQQNRYRSPSGSDYQDSSPAKFPSQQQGTEMRHPANERGSPRSSSFRDQRRDRDRRDGMSEGQSEVSQQRDTRRGFPAQQMDAYQRRFGPVSEPQQQDAWSKPVHEADGWAGGGASSRFARDSRGGSDRQHRDQGWQAGSGRQRDYGNEGQDRWQPSRGMDNPRSSWQQDSVGWDRNLEELGSSSMPEVEGEVVYGVSPVLAAFSAQRRNIFTLFVQEGLGKVQGEGRRKERGAPEHAIASAESVGATVTYISKHDLNMLTHNRPHQGLALDCSPLDWVGLDEMPAAAANQNIPIWLALDEVTDPHNFGAVLRSAHFLGASGVMASQKNCAPLSAAVSKASAGALEAVPVHACANLPRLLSEAAASGWTVLGAAAEEGAQDCTAVAVHRPTILVVGSEGYGLRTTVRRACTGFVKVAGMNTAAENGSSASIVPDSEVDSLNVSVATGILLHQLLQAASAATAATDSPAPGASTETEQAASVVAAANGQKAPTANGASVQASAVAPEEAAACQ